MTKASDNLSIFKSKVSKSYETISSAYHEAGHALFCLLKFLKIIEVKIFEDQATKDICGLTRFYSYVESSDTLQVKNYFVQAEIGVNYAGLVAEKILYKKISGLDKFPSFLKDGSSFDTEEASKLIIKYNISFPGKARLAYKKKLTKQIQGLLENHWADIELLSHLLIQKKKVSFEQIKNCLTKKSKSKSFWKERFKSIELLFAENEIASDPILKILLEV